MRASGLGIIQRTLPSSSGIVSTNLSLQGLQHFRKAVNLGIPLCGRKHVASVQRSLGSSSRRDGRPSPSLFVLSPCSPGFDDGGGKLNAPSQEEQTMQMIRRTGIIACLHLTNAQAVHDAARAALDGGITVLEITLDTPSALEVIRLLVHEYPHAAIGAGTVLWAGDAEAAEAAGARFLMSPIANEALIQHFRDSHSTVLIPGAMTPTEIFRAHQAGARIVKVFPASTLGGPAFLKALQRPLAHIPLVPSRGISLEMVEPYMRAGATAVVLSGAIFDRKAVTERNFGAIRQRAERVVNEGRRLVEAIASEKRTCGE